MGLKWPVAFGRPLAAVLAAHGVASYRFDRRGIGATPGQWKQGGFYQHRRDDEQVVRAIAARPDAAAIVLIGCPATTGADGMVAWAEHPDAEIP